MKEYTAQHIETRIVRDGKYSKLPRVHNGQDAYNLVKDMQNEAVEKFVALFLSTRNDVIAISVLFSGDMTQSVVSPRFIVKIALDINATALIVAHNHPSGDCKPSREDRIITAQLRKACDLFDIRLLDHIIIGADDFYCIGPDGEAE